MRFFFLLCVSVTKEKIKWSSSSSSDTCHNSWQLSIVVHFKSTGTSTITITHHRYYHYHWKCSHGFIRMITTITILNWIETKWSSSSSKIIFGRRCRRKDLTARFKLGVQCVQCVCVRNGRMNFFFSKRSKMEGMGVVIVGVLEW